MTRAARGPGDLAVLDVRDDARAAIERGHPWLWDRAVAMRSAIGSGQLVRVRDRRGPIGVGYADPGSPIAVRMLWLSPPAHRGASDGAGHVAPPDEANAPDVRGAGDPAFAEWVRARVAESARTRRALPPLAGATGLRVVHGENDYLPGLVVDVYADTAVAVFDGVGARALWQPHADAIVDGLRDGLQASAQGGAGIPPDSGASAECPASVHIARLWARAQRRTKGRAGNGDSHAPDGEPLVGDPPPPEIAIVEPAAPSAGGVARFAVDVRRGQKTGFYLDQRDNRRRVGELAAGAEVLNLYAYTGGFSVHAALGGARRVTSVDLAAPAIAAARENFARNGLDPGAHAFVAEDAPAFLDRAAAQGRRFDLVIADPPSQAPNKRTLPRALASYRRINERALDVLEPGGLLVTASCSSHVTEAHLLDAVADATRARGRRARIIEIAGPGPDHPIRPGFPEGRYLTVVFAAVV